MMRNGWQRVLVVLAMLAAPCVAAAAPAAATTAPAYWCVKSHSPWGAYRERRAPLPHKCNAGYIIARVRAGTTQLVTVGAKSHRTSWATLNTFVWTGGKWAHRRGPWTARIGQDGMATIGQKIEGDLLTPQGTYGFRFMFGVRANPGVHFSWRHAYTYNYWVDDSASPLYNEWVDIRHQDAGANPEPMHNVPVYNYAAVIAYNTARKPGVGSAIFLHVGNGSATAGCVSLPTRHLLVVLRWLNPDRHPVIAMRVIP